MVMFNSYVKLPEGSGFPIAPIDYPRVYINDLKWRIQTQTAKERANKSTPAFASMCEFISCYFYPMRVASI